MLTVRRLNSSPGVNFICFRLWTRTFISSLQSMVQRYWMRIIITGFFPK
jgi:hypothetical protein